MLSAVYQQASSIPGLSTSPPLRKGGPGGVGSTANPDSSLIDPENRLLWKMPRRRLDFEALRDSLLAVSGTLDDKLGGPSVNLLHRLLCARSATGDDGRIAGEFFGPDAASRESKEPWERYTHALLLTNEFVFVD